MVRRCSHLINALRPKRLNLDSSDNKQVSVVGSTGTKAAGEQGVVQKERHSRQMRANDDLQPDRPAQTQLVSAAGRAGAAGRGNGIASEVSRHILTRCHFDPLRQKIRCRATELLLGCCRGERYIFLAIRSVLGRSNRLRHGVVLKSREGIPIKERAGAWSGDYGRHITCLTEFLERI